VSILEISVTAGPDGPVVVLSGEADVTTAGQLGKALAAQVSADVPQPAVARALSLLGVWGRPAAGRPHTGWQRRFQAVTACLVSLLVTWMLRGLAASWTGMVRVSTPAA
jgi:hypothetical protein